MKTLPEDVAGIAAVVRSGEATAKEVVEAVLARIPRRDPEVNAFTAVTADRARAEAAAIDAARSNGQRLPPLAGVPYAVKNLYDVAGLPTLAGSKINEDRPPAENDAALVSRLQAAGAVLVGTLNMDAYAYGFTTENTAYGVTHNPHDPSRSAGGSSGGSGAAVAAGLVPLTLGSDTNGSIRVPASFCGIFGLKPTFGRLPRTGAALLSASLDHLGPLATTTADLAAAYDVLQGPDPRDPACAPRPAEPIQSSLADGIDGLRVGRLTGYFDRFATAGARKAAVRVAEALGSAGDVELPEVEAARAAAFVITAAEGGALHLETLRRRYADFEPLSRDRFVAGALTPSAWYLQAQRIRAWFRDRVREAFEDYDLLVAPATPCPATPLGAEWLEIDGGRLPLRPSIGLLTQPISFAGLPVVCVPVAGPGSLPIGVQLIAAPWREDVCLRASSVLERAGVARAFLAGDEVSPAAGDAPPPRSPASRRPPRRTPPARTRRTP